MAELRYNKEKDIYEKVEDLPPDAVDQQISSWKTQVDFHETEKQKFLAMIDGILALKKERDDAQKG